MLAKTQDALTHTALSAAVLADPLLKQLLTQH